MPHPVLVSHLTTLGIKTVVDVGASDGRFSRDLWHFLPEARYILIDPLQYPQKWEGHNITWVHKVLHDEDGGTIPFSETEDPFRSGCYGEDAATRSVATTTLSKVCEGLDNIFLKLDTHGVETEILGEHLPVLRQKIPLVQIEVYNFPLSPTSPMFYDMTQFMASYGYRVVTLLDTLYRGDGCLWQMDFLFAHKENPVFNRSDYFYA